MNRRKVVHRTGLAAAAVAVLVPGAAWAGKRVTAGDHQSLQLSVSVQPNQAGARLTKLHLHTDYRNSTGNGQQPPVNGSAIILKLAKGTTFHFAAAHACKESATIKAPTTSAPCPANTKTGSGSVIVNARPTVAALIHGKVTAFNGVDDGGAGGYGKGKPVVILWVKTTIGVNVIDYFHVVKAGGTLELIGKNTKPSHPGFVAGDFTLQTLDLTSTGNASAYFNNPPKCTGSWGFALTLTNFFGQPPITAPDKVACRA
jgi:hypothetical protein